MSSCGPQSASSGSGQNPALTSCTHHRCLRTWPAQQVPIRAVKMKLREVL